MTDQVVAERLTRTNDLLGEIMSELRSLRKEVHELRVDTYRATGTMHPDVARERVEGGS